MSGPQTPRSRPPLRRQWQARPIYHSWSHALFLGQTSSESGSPHAPAGHQALARPVVLPSAPVNCPADQVHELRCPSQRMIIWFAHARDDHKESKGLVEHGRLGRPENLSISIVISKLVLSILRSRRRDATVHFAAPKGNLNVLDCLSLIVESCKRIQSTNLDFRRLRLVKYKEISLWCWTGSRAFSEPSMELSVVCWSISWRMTKLISRVLFITTRTVDWSTLVVSASEARVYYISYMLARILYS